MLLKTVNIGIIRSSTSETNFSCMNSNHRNYGYLTLDALACLCLLGIVTHYVHFYVSYLAPMAPLSLLKKKSRGDFNMECEHGEAGQLHNGGARCSRGVQQEEERCQFLFEPVRIEEKIKDENK